LTAKTCDGFISNNRELCEMLMRSFVVG